MRKFAFTFANRTATQATGDLRQGEQIAAATGKRFLSPDVGVWCPVTKTATQFE